jgi:hypothetical protein
MKSLTGFSSTLKEQMAADKKKTALLFGLGAVLLVVVGQLFISGDSPAPAEADDTIVVSSPPKSEPQRTLIRPDPERTDVSNPRKRTGGPRRPSSDRPASSPGGALVTVEGMPRTAARDLFSTSAWGQFPSAEQPQGEAEPSVESGPGFLAQWGMRLEERKEARRQALLAVREEAQALDLQSTMTGQVAAAYISGRLVHEGDTIAGFSVVRIEDRRVILEKSGASQALTMP